MPARVAESGADWTLPPVNSSGRWRALRGPHEIRAGLRLHGDPERGVARYDNGRRAADISPNDRPDLPIRGFQVRLSAGRQDQARVLVPTEDAAHAVAQEFVADGRIPEGSGITDQARSATAGRRSDQWRTYIADAMRARHLPEYQEDEGGRFRYKNREARISKRRPTPGKPELFHVFLDTHESVPALGGDVRRVSTEYARAGLYGGAVRIARDFVANGRNPEDRTGRDLLPERARVHAGDGRLTIENRVQGRYAVLTQRQRGDEYATEIALVDGWDQRMDPQWAGTRPHFTQGLDVATDYLDTGRVPKEPSRPRPAFPERYDLPPLPEGLQMSAIGRLSASYVPPGTTIETAKRGALVDWTGNRERGSSYQVLAFRDGQPRSSYAAPTYRDAHLKAREFVRRGEIPAPPDDRERLPIPSPPAGRRRVGNPER